MKNKCLLSICFSRLGETTRRARGRGARRLDPHWGTPVCQPQGAGKEARPKTVPVLGDVGDGKLEQSFVSLLMKFGNLGAAATRVIRPGWCDAVWTVEPSGLVGQKPVARMGCQIEIGPAGPA